MKRNRRILSLILCFLLLVPANWVSAASPITETVSGLSQFTVYNSGMQLPSETDGTITTTGGALKLLALEKEQNTVEKTFGDFYNADNYSVYGNGYTKANYAASFEDGKITTGNVQTKLRLKETSAVSDFDMGFTIQKISVQALWGGVAFRIQDEDFRTAPFGTKGYMLYLYSAATSTDVTINLRRYNTSGSTITTTSSATATGLLTNPMDAIKTQLTVTGTSLSVTISDAENPQSSYTTKFNLRPDEKEYFSQGSIAFVSNGDHSFTDISLTAVTEEWQEVEKPIYGLMEESSYTVYGNQSTLDNYGVSFDGGGISTAGQSKVMLKQRTDIEDFSARFSLTKTNGNSLYGGIAFHVQNCGLTKGSFGGPGYLLYAQSAADSMDVTLYLRNYLTETSYVQTTVATVKGLLAAPTDGVTFQVQARGTKLSVTVADAVDQSRVSKEYEVSLLSGNAKAGNYTGGSIAFVSNGSHAYTDISLTQIEKDRPYIQVENFTATADFTLPNSTYIQQGIMFYVQKAANCSPGLSGYALNLIRASESADHVLTAQLVLYGTDSSGNQMVNLGAIKTQPISDLLTEANGAGETVRLTLTVVRGNLTFHLENLSNGKSSTEYTVALDTATNKGYAGCYESGGIGYFTNVAGTKMSGLTVTKLHDCTVSLGEYTGGSAENDGVYSYQETVTVKAEPDSDYYFAGWYDGETLLSKEKEYSFVIEEDMVLTPVFLLLPVRFVGISGDGSFAALELDSIAGVESVGFEITVKYGTDEASQGSERSSTLDTDYVRQQTVTKAPYIATTQKVYYADVDNNGVIDRDDLTALRRYLLTVDSVADNNETAIGAANAAANVNTGAADVNGDKVCDIKDVVRLKSISGITPGGLDEFDNDYTYPFAIGDLLSGSGTEYVKLIPFATTGGAQAYGTPRYVTYKDGAVVTVSNSPN